MSAAPHLPDWLALAENPYLQGPFAPVFDECDAADLKVIGELPRGLAGVSCATARTPCLRRAAAITGSTATAWCTP